MFLEENNDAIVQSLHTEGRRAIYNLMRSCIEREGQLSQAGAQQADLDQEVKNRLARILS